MSSVHIQPESPSWTTTKVVAVIVAILPAGSMAPWAIAAVRAAGYLGERICGSAHCFELELRLGAGILVDVGVELARQLAIGRLDRGLRCVALDTEDLVVVLEFHAASSKSGRRN